MQGDREALQARPAAKAPRSLTLTFAESHPWEMIVRDRLAVLPRGYLKRLVLTLIEQSGLDLEDEDQFRHQVERLLVTRRLSGTFAARADERLERAAVNRESVQRKIGATSLPIEPEPPKGAAESGAAPSECPQEARGVATHPNPSASRDQLSRSNRPDDNQGFGALEL